MKIHCDRVKFLEAFQIVASVVPVRSPKVVLQNVKLEVEKDRVVLSATDMEVGIRYTVSGVEIDAPGSTLLPVSRFSSILREAPDDKLEIEVTSKGVRVHGQRSNFLLPAANPDEFPDVASFSDEAYHEVPAGFLKEIIHRTIFATDNESSRYALSGVLFELNDEDLIAVGTDGRRLAKMQGPSQSIGGHKTGESTIIVPSRALQLIDRALSDQEAQVKFSTHSNDILIQCSNVTIYSRLVEGRFPKWRDVFPKRDENMRIELPVGLFYSAVRQAAIVTSEESRGVDFTFGEGNAVLAGEAAETGQSRIELPIEYNGKPITVMLDPKYMSDFLKVLDADKIFSLEIKDSKSAAVCTTDDGYGYVIMPMARDR
ncbi:MAG: DNA polymerase III subunit beta [Pirellulales bacterium]|jgi:DNA polymerase-3 subunit beta|nr:DNA polymerase III subunit beta [Pirellulales bacterium]